MGNIPVGFCWKWSLYFNTFFGYRGDLKLKESRSLSENALTPHERNLWDPVKGEEEGLSQIGKQETEMGQTALQSAETLDICEYWDPANEIPSPSSFTPPSSPGYKSGHPGSTALACSVPPALGPQPGSALAASPELLEAEAEEIREKTWEIIRGWPPGSLSQIHGVMCTNEWRSNIPPTASPEYCSLVLRPTSRGGLEYPLSAHASWLLNRPCHWNANATLKASGPQREPSAQQQGS